MNSRTLGIFAVSAMLGAALATSSVAQDRQRGFDGPRGEARGAPARARARPGLRAGIRRGAAAQPERFLKRYDTDGDGKVSEMEFLDDALQRVDTLFERRDDNDNGLISSDEHAAPVARPGRARRGERARADRSEVDRDAITACVRETIADYEPRFDGEREDAFADRDSNSDGALSLQEVSASVEARAQELFARIDANGDAYLSEEEVAAHFEQQVNVRRAVRDCVVEQRTG